MGEFSQQLAELAEFWNKVEDRIKLAEQLRSATVIPAINELRYAGRKFVDAWSIQQKENITPADQKEIDESIVIARQYLINADHDAIDAGLTFIYRNLRFVSKRYRKSSIAKHIPSFLSGLDEMAEYEVRIRLSRKDRSQRNGIYDGMIPHFERMMLLHAEVDRVERHVLRDEKRTFFVRNIFALIGLIGSIASIFAIFLSWAQIKVFIGWS